MTPQEKLAQLEKKLKSHYGTLEDLEPKYNSISVGGAYLRSICADYELAICRIKELEAQNKKLREALEKIEKHQGHAVGAYTFGWREIARQALTEGETK